jgi:hypothetical protein
VVVQVLKMLLNLKWLITGRPERQQQLVPVRIGIKILLVELRPRSS